MRGSTPKYAGFVGCPGYQNDVEYVRKGLIAIGYHNSDCFGGTGVRLVDVSDPSRPRLLGAVNFPGGTHTLTKVPGRNYIYSSPGGLGANDERIIDISNPRDPEVVKVFTPTPMGCHDVSFHAKRKLGFCAGSNETVIWDISKPASPVVVGHVPNGAFFHHSAVASPDGKLLVVGDEALEGHACAGGAPTGSLWFHDITTPAAPVLVGFQGPRRGGTVVGSPLGYNTWCTAHNYNFIPGTRFLVSAWYTGGTSVLDLSNPSVPKEVAYFQADDSAAWSSYYYGGRIYVNDISRGTDVIQIKKLPKVTSPLTLDSESGKLKPMAAPPSVAKRSALEPRFICLPGRSDLREL